MWDSDLVRLAESIVKGITWTGHEPHCCPGRIWDFMATALKAERRELIVAPSKRDAGPNPLIKSPAPLQPENTQDTQDKQFQASAEDET